MNAWREGRVWHQAAGRRWNDPRNLVGQTEVRRDEGVIDSGGLSLTGSSWLRLVVRQDWPSWMILISICFSRNLRLVVRQDWPSWMIWRELEVRIWPASEGAPSRQERPKSYRGLATLLATFGSKGTGGAPFHWQLDRRTPLLKEVEQANQTSFDVQ